LTTALSTSFPHCAPALHSVIPHSEVQGAESRLPLSTIIATHKMAACVMYDVIHEAWHEVCMYMLFTCLKPNATRLMLSSLCMLVACCSPQLRIISALTIAHRFVVPCMIYDLVHLAGMQFTLRYKILRASACSSKWKGNK
jgi:hypothetical protein